MKKQITLIFSLIFVAASLTAAQTARRTITNDDLEKFKQKRVQSEEEYRANYKKLGMPSPEELERIEAERQAWHAEYARQTALINQEAQNSFVAQANQLKSEITGIQAQINYLRVQLNNLPSNQDTIFVRPEDFYGVGGVAVFGGGGVVGGNRGGVSVTPHRGGGGGGGRFVGSPRTYQAPNVQTAINAAAGAPNPYFGTPLQRTGVKAVVGQPNYGGRRGGFRNPGYNYGGYNYGGYYAGGYDVPSPLSTNIYRREDFISRLSSLEQAKAGLLAQLNLIREEARRAGVKID